jgi:CheY-like chemotaxis protein
MKKGNILVVEDDIIIGSLIKNRLEKLGYTVYGIVSTGEEAVTRVAEQMPDLVLMDIHLNGEMDGITATRIIHEQHTLPVVYLTSYSDEKTLERAKMTGPAGYIIKPFTDDVLRTTIEIAMYRHIEASESAPMPENG